MTDTDPRVPAPVPASREQEIAARLAAATPGPWRVAGKREREGFVEGHILCPDECDASGERMLASTNYHYHDEADQQFIAHSRSDMEWLLAQLAAAREEARLLRGEVSKLRGAMELARHGLGLTSYTPDERIEHVVVALARSLAVSRQRTYRPVAALAAHQE